MYYDGDNVSTASISESEITMYTDGRSIENATAESTNTCCLYMLLYQKTTSI